MPAIDDATVDQLREQLAQAEADGEKFCAEIGRLTAGLIDMASNTGCGCPCCYTAKAAAGKVLAAEADLRRHQMTTSAAKANRNADIVERLEAENERLRAALGTAASMVIALAPKDGKGDATPFMQAAVDIAALASQHEQEARKP